LKCSFEELRQSILVLGPDDSAHYPNGNHAWRSHLVDNLEILTRQLWPGWHPGDLRRRIIAEDKDHPNDIDGYLVCDLLQLSSGELTRQLIDRPVQGVDLGTSIEEALSSYPKKQLPMWHRYRIELYPHIPGMESVAESSTGMAMNWSFHLRFDSRAATASPEGL